MAVSLALRMFLPLLWMAVQGAPAAQKGALSAEAIRHHGGPDSNHRVIVSFADHKVELGWAKLLEEKALELRAKPGVLDVKALRLTGMAVVACDSSDAEERLVRELEEDPLVKLATPDTWVQQDEAAAPPVPGAEGTDLRQCSAQPHCAALELVGRCCPTADGLMLACCSETTTTDVVTFRTYQGKYIAVEAGGIINAWGEQVFAQEKFQLYENSDGTVSMRTHFGKYVGVNPWGGVYADRLLTRAWEKFHLIVHAQDGRVSLKSIHGTFVTVEPDGRLTAFKRLIDDQTSFTMTRVERTTQRIPDDANFTALWGMHNDKGTDIDATEAWKTFTGEASAGIVVAVIDTGIDYTHQDLRQNMWVNPGEIPDNGIDDDLNGFVDDVYGADFVNEDGDPMDDQSHGTHCSGTIAGVGNNDRGIAGVAWRGVRLMALKFLDDTGSGRASDAVKAIEYGMAHGAKIMSNSWGSSGSSAAVRVAIERAEAAGILFVAAAGNSGDDNDQSPHYPSSYPADSIIAVASTNVEGEMSSFSCWGEKSVDLAAPGSRIFSTVPHQRYAFLSGTSMATPHVSGLAALVWMYRPALRMEQVKEVLMHTVDKLEVLQGRMVSGGRINAKNALEMAAAVEPMYAPIHLPRGISFADVDPKVGVIGGTVTITAARDESDISYYKVYWLSRAGFQLDPVASVTANGSTFLEVHLPGPTVLPKLAVGLVAVSGNATGENPPQLGLAPSVTVVDSGTPDQKPLRAEWEGDEDMRKGFVAGTLSLARAVDESSITQYNIYWSDNASSRGQLLGSIPAVGFAAPTCLGRSCSLINQTGEIGRRRFNRDAYTDSESAEISFAGPANVTVTRFNTESYYDHLTIGTDKLSGEPSVPIVSQLPAGPQTVKWHSDGSITDLGWTLELLQTDAVVGFRVEATQLLDRGLEVVPAYHGTEMSKGIFVEVPDFDHTMPPSPAFAPAAVDFMDAHLQQGIVSGVVQVTPAKVVSASGLVTYYQVNFADDSGAQIGDGWRAVARAGTPPLASIPTTRLPPKAAKLVVIAGNSVGLGGGRAEMMLADAFSGRPVAVAGTSLQLAAEPPAESAHGDDQPWLRPVQPAGEQHAVWSRAVPAFVEARVTHVRSAVTVFGLQATTVTTPAFREVFASVVLKALPRLQKDAVKLSGIFSQTAAAAGAEARPAAAEKTDATLVKFEVDAPDGVNTELLDRIEARLILLSKGGSSAQRFEQALLASLTSLGVALPPGAQVRVQAPQQVAPQRQGRKLTGTAAEAPPDQRHNLRMPISSGKIQSANQVFATELAAALAGTSIVGAALLLVRRRRAQSPQSYLGLAP